MSDAGIILLFIVMVFGAFLILRSIKNFIINAVVGLVILFLANHVAGLDIGYSWLVILICGIGGSSVRSLLSCCISCDLEFKPTAEVSKRCLLSLRAIHH